jgi:hypothetical protein
MPDNFSNGWTEQSAALVIAHPGHELRIHHWLERARPVTFVLTDGSGHTDHSRISSTTTVLDHAGARRGAIYGAMSDRELYQAILSGERDLFGQLAEQLAVALRREDVAYVVGDAVEGVNPGHDVCRLILNAALLRMSGMGGRPPRNMEYPVEGPPDDCPTEDRPEAILLKLDDEAYQRKIAAAQAYPELASELKRVLAVHNVEAFRVECLRPVRYEMDIKDRFRHPCVYEWYGEKQVAAGIYKDVIRFREHIAPLAADLERRSSRGHSA